MPENAQITADMAVAIMSIPAAGDVQIVVAEKGEAKLPTFSFRGYTGAPMNLAGFYHPVIVDLEGAKVTDPIGALMRHDEDRIVGQGTATVGPDGIRATGTVMSEDADAQRITNLSKNGFKWQASIGADIVRREFLEPGKTLTVNGREVVGPMIIARETLVHEISFVRRGADSQTSAAVAASHSNRKVTAMDPKFATWLEAKGFAAESLTEQQVKTLEAAWKAETATAPRPPQSVDAVLAAAEAKLQNQQRIADITARFLQDNPGAGVDLIAKVKTLAELAIEADWSHEKYDTELLRASRPNYRTFNSRASDNRVTDKVLEAAICATGRLADDDKMVKMFGADTLEAAHKEFKSRIGLKQLMLFCAGVNGYRSNHGTEYTIEAHRAAFGFTGPNQLRAAGFSTLNIATVLSNTANKFLMQGWLAVDQTPLRIASIRPVNDLKTVTTVSLTGDLQYEKLGSQGEIKHGKMNEVTYTNKAETYAKMLAISEDDFINDDLGALTQVPRRLGRGAGLKLNDIFWTEFLGAEAEGFFASGNSNVNTGVADMTIGGLTATEVIFMNQVDPDSKPLGIMPAIILVPTALKAAAVALMDPQGVMITGASATIPNSNPFKGRFRVESSPYMSNSAYTGYSAAAWYMMADPNELPTIEIAAYQGRVEPTVDSAQTDFNTLGVQFRGVSRVGVNLQEYRAAVKPDGGAS